jgi:hypothetical protein
VLEFETNWLPLRVAPVGKLVNSCTVSNLPRSRMQRQPTHLEFGFRKSPVV